MKKTPWFDGSVKPVRVGVYERLFLEGTPSQVVRMCLFDGVWRFNADTAHEASKKTRISEYENLKWRGLTKPPKGTE